MNVPEKIKQMLNGHGPHGHGKSGHGPRKTNLLESHTTKTIHIEFTSRCNLRCTFCHASQPDYNGRELDADTLKNIINEIKSRNPAVVSVNGHGETTIYKNWHQHCNQMLDAGIPLHVISNFAKEMSPDELHALSRFQSIEISCDTSDPDLFKRIRRGANLETLCLNIMRLRETAEKKTGHMPKLSFSCVVSDQNVLSLMDYVSFARSLGVGHFNFCNLTKYPDLDHIANPNHITEMPIEMLHEAEISLTKTFEFLQHKGVPFHFQQGLLDSLREKIRSVKTPPTPVKQPVAASVAPVAPHRYSAGKQAAHTRDCLDPWSFVQVQANRDILPCCWHEPVYSLGKNQSLSDVLNNQRMKKLRRELLTGELPWDCMSCPCRGWTTVSELQKKVWRYLNPGISGYLPHRAPVIEPDVLSPLNMRYGDGWYDVETNTGIDDPEWRSWRWTSKRAACTLENRGRGALLMLRGSVDTSKHDEQTIVIRLGDYILDEFQPGTAKFYKEYALTPEQLGNNSEISLVIETDRTFIPSALDPAVTDHRELGIQVYELLYAALP